MDNSIAKFLGEDQNMKNVINAYINIRHELKKLGHTEETAQRITNITPILGLNKTAFDYYLKSLTEDFEELFNLDKEKLLFYVRERLNKIDELIPLNDVDKEGRD